MFEQMGSCVKKKRKADERIKIGEVGVDSGQLLITDPCYIGKVFEDAAKKHYPKTYIKYWGRDKEKVSAALMERGYDVNRMTQRADRIEVESVAKAELVVHDVLRPLQNTLKFCYTTVAAGDVYGLICAEHAKGGRHAQLRFAKGHDGLGVVFSPGFGDGCYQVFATLRDCGEWGTRVAKVEIVLMDDDDRP